MNVRLFHYSANFSQLFCRHFAVSSVLLRAQSETASVDEASREMKSRSLSSRLQSMKDSSDLIIRKRHPYTPREGTREEILGVAGQMFSLKDEDELLSCRLDDPLLKYRLVTRCTSLFPRTVSNTELHSIETVADVLEHFCTSVEQEDGLYTIAASKNLPKNLHIQKEPIRFHPVTDKMFNGVTAYPGRDTIVSGLRFRRKYQDLKANKDVPRQIDLHEE